MARPPSRLKPLTVGLGTAALGGRTPSKLPPEPAGASPGLDPGLKERQKGPSSCFRTRLTGTLTLTAPGLPPTPGPCFPAPDPEATSCTPRSSAASPPDLGLDALRQCADPSHRVMPVRDPGAAVAAQAGLRDFLLGAGEAARTSPGYEGRVKGHADGTWTRTRSSYPLSRCQRPGGLSLGSPMLA